MRRSGWVGSTLTSSSPLAHGGTPAKPSTARFRIDRIGIQQVGFAGLVHEVERAEIVFEDLFR